MKKNLILYVVAGAVVLAGLVSGGVIVGKRVLSKDEVTTAAVTAYVNNQVEVNEAEDPVAVEPVDDATTGETGETAAAVKEKLTDDKGSPIQLVTDKQGNTLQAVIETKAGTGEKVTKANGEVVTKTPTPTKKSTAATTAASKTKETTTAKVKSTQKASSNSTIVYNDDGTASIVKSDGSVALNYSYSKAGNYFYTDDNPWQRKVGFNRLYDMGAAFTVMYYDTIRVYYTHGKYDWLVQMWKGQYGFIFIGSEIGLYYKEKSKITNHYECATEDMEIPMQMTLYRKDTKLFTRPYAPHWWITAFVPGKLTKFSDRSELTMIGKMTFKTTEECNKFVNALTNLKDVDGNRFKTGAINKDNPETYKVSGKTVDFVWRNFDADRKTSKTAASTKTTTAKTTAPETTKSVIENPVTVPVVETPTTSPAPTDPPETEKVVVD